MKKRPKLHEIILERGTRKQQATLSIEIDQSLPPLTLKIFDVLRFIKHEIIPFLSLERKRILYNKLI